MIRLTLASNAIHLEAARRLCQEGRRRPAALDLLIWEPRRCALSAADRRRWPLRLPVGSLSLSLVVPLALVGLVGELRLAHLRDAGRALRWIAARSRRLVLLDDGLDQYRQWPRALDPSAFPAGTPCWLFSDAPAFRADWCRRFDCHELGPLYPSPPAAAGPRLAERELDPSGTLIIDSPGVERGQSRQAELPRPWCLVPHPVERKRAWTQPLAPADRQLRVSPEQLLPGWRGTVLVGESLMLLAALRLCADDVTLVVALPAEADSQLQALVADAVRRRPGRLVVL